MIKQIWRPLRLQYLFDQLNGSLIEIKYQFWLLWQFYVATLRLDWPHSGTDEVHWNWLAFSVINYNTDEVLIKVTEENDTRLERISYWEVTSEVFDECIQTFMLKF